MKVAIVGLGFVGKSLLNGIKDSVEVKTDLIQSLDQISMNFKDFLP
jgi:hypothetical protein